MYQILGFPNLRKLIDAVINHPQLREVEQIALYCLPEMIPFYQRWGFTNEVGEIELMYRYNQSSPETDDY